MTQLEREYVLISLPCAVAVDSIARSAVSSAAPSRSPVGAESA